MTLSEKFCHSEGATGATRSGTKPEKTIFQKMLPKPKRPKNLRFDPAGTIYQNRLKTAPNKKKPDIVS
jgi:hypothetical protein